MTKNTCDLYVFDLDGTLLDTLDDLADSVNATLSRFGYSLRTREKIREFVGNGMKNLIELSLGGVPENFFEVLAYFKAYYKENSTNKTKPYDGVIELLKRLRAEGKKTAIVSNKADFATKLLAEKYFAGLIDIAIGENEDGGVRKKPAPDSVERVLEALSVTKERAVYIGDSEVDVETAKNAGLPCISVTWGFRDVAFLTERGATTFVNHPSEIE